MNEKPEYNKILFIDDDRNLANIYNSILERKNLSDYLIYFDNAVDGIKYLTENNEKNPATFILLDLYMPEMSGFEFLKYLDKLKPVKDSVEVYVCTSSKDKEDRKKVMNYSFVNAYLEKPIPGDFLELLIKDGV
jgi:response regulator RpfG family c-di-GMP phosphodiesterase